MNNTKLKNKLITKQANKIFKKATKIIASSPTGPIMTMSVNQNEFFKIIEDSLNNNTTNPDEDIEIVKFGKWKGLLLEYGSTPNKWEEKIRNDIYELEKKPELRYDKIFIKKLHKYFKNFMTDMKMAHDLLEEAKKQYLILTQNEPEVWEHFYNIAEIYYILKNYKEAKKYYELTLRIRKICKRAIQEKIDTCDKKLYGSVLRLETYITGITHREHGEYFINNAKTNDPIVLIREKDNKYDKNAVAVYWKNKHVGYIPKTVDREGGFKTPEALYGSCSSARAVDCKEVAKRIDSGVRFDTIISRKYKRSVTIELREVGW